MCVRRTAYRFPEFVEFLTRSGSTSKSASDAVPSPVQTTTQTEEALSLNPEEVIGSAHARLEREVKDELLRRLMSKSPAFFEELIVALLSAMGYGNEETLAEAVGRPGDGGIDGIIHQDKLGLDIVYMQAKRYDPGRPVSSPDLQSFVGALTGRGAAKGVFVTTSSFSKPALDYLATVQQRQRVIAIDGERLVDLMVEYGIGVRVKQTLHLHRIDEDFFLDE